MSIQSLEVTAEPYSHGTVAAGELTAGSTTDGQDAFDFGNRALNIARYRSNIGLADSEPLPSPWTLEFEPTLYCNARCHFCSYEKDIERFSAKSRELKRNLSISGFAIMSVLEAVREAGTTKGTYWSGGGEPLLWKPLGECLEYAATFSDTSLQTNGVLLDKFTVSPDKLATLSLITVSTYSNKSNQHRQIAGIDSLDRVTQNIKNAVKLRNGFGLGTIVGAKVIVDKNNYLDLPQIISFYRSLGVDIVSARLAQDYNYGGEGQRKKSVELGNAEREELVEIIKRSDPDPSLQALEKQLVAPPGSRAPITSDCHNTTQGHFACVDAWGDVYLGNPEIGDKNLSIGNILDSHWSEIWKSPRHYEVIEKMTERQRQGRCPRDLCRHVKANAAIDRYLARSDDGATYEPQASGVMRSFI